MRSIREIIFTPKELDVILIQPNFLMKILKEEQNQIVREYWESMENQEPLGDLPNEVNHGLFSLAASLRRGGADKNLDTYRDLKGDIDVFRRTEGKGTMYLSSDRICYRYSASTWLSQQRTPVYLDS